MCNNVTVCVCDQAEKEKTVRTGGGGKGQGMWQCGSVAVTVWRRGRRGDGAEKGEGVMGDNITMCDRRVEGQIRKVLGEGCECTIV